MTALATTRKQKYDSAPIVSMLSHFDMNAPRTDSLTDLFRWLLAARKQAHDKFRSLVRITRVEAAATSDYARLLRAWTVMKALHVFDDPTTGLSLRFVDKKHTYLLPCERTEL